MTKVVISNGFNRIHIATAAAHMAQRGELAMMLTGAYPTPAVKRMLGRLGLAGSPKLQRLLGREEDIPPALVQPLWISDAIYSARDAVRPLYARLSVAGLRSYMRQAARHIPTAAARGARVYHYRAGFGGPSVAVARKAGMVCLCDHSIVHPVFVESLPGVHGRLDEAARTPPQTAFERQILADIDQADQWLFNSEFVRDTFVALGYDPSRMHVIYQGVDDDFMRGIPPRPPQQPGPLRLMAPAFNARKGAPTLVAALTALDDVDWRLSITRQLDPGVREQYAAFLADPRVTCSAPERPELARVMTEHDAIVFPTYAEGSARVVFEALATGTYVITTPNAGSVVRDGVHGRIVPPGDPEALRGAVREAAGMRARLPAIGEANAAFIRAHYHQRVYGESVAALYDRLVAGG